MKRIFSLLITFVIVISVSGQSITGLWKTIDDKTGEPKSIVKIYEKNGKIYGDIIKLFNNDPNYNPLCDKCPETKRNKHLIGLTIIEGLSLNDGKWTGKDGILDPENGKVYTVKIWREGNNLQVRGYIAFFYRTQTWLKAD